MTQDCEAIERAEAAAVAVLEDDESEGLDMFTLGVKVADAVLAVVGQGVTAEQAWDEGYRAGARGHCDVDECDITGDNPYRTHPSGQEPTP